MNGVGNKFLIVMALLLTVLIGMQFTAMMQSDRLYTQLNRIATAMQSGSFRAAPVAAADADETFAAEAEGDWLVWRLSMEPATLNYIHVSSDVTTFWMTLELIQETLLQYSWDSLELEPVLARSFSVSEDGLQIDFELRDDVHFSDGEPITADDIIFTYQTIVNPKVDAASLANYFADVESVEKIDERQVRFHMKRKYFLSLATLGEMPIFPEHAYRFEDPAEFNERISEPVGSGPYLFDEWVKGDRVVLRRNDRYWGERPKLDRIVFKFITNDTAAVQALRTGNIDYMRPLPDQYAELSQNEEFTEENRCLSYWHPAVGYFWIGWNQQRPFFQDARVRRAMTHIVDREKICQFLLKNPEAKVPTGPFYIHGRQSNPDIEPWPYDPKRAAELLDEAGWVDTDGDGIRDKDGVKFSFRYMIVSNADLHEQVAKLVKDAAARVGIQVEIDPYEWSVFIQRVQDRQFDAVNMAWHGVVETDPHQIWHSSQIGNRGSNYVGFNVPEADRLIEQARQTLDTDKRNALYHRFHEIIHREQPYTFVYTRPEQRFLDKRFENVTIHAKGLDEKEWFVPAGLQKY